MYLQDAVETQDVVKRFAEFHFRFDLIFWLIVDEIKRKFLQHSLWLLLLFLLLMLWYANGICAGQEAAHTKRRVRFRFLYLSDTLHCARHFPCHSAAVCICDSSFCCCCAFWQTAAAACKYLRVSAYLSDAAERGAGHRRHSFVIFTRARTCVAHTSTQIRNADIDAYLQLYAYVSLAVQVAVSASEIYLHSVSVSETAKYWVYSTERQRYARKLYMYLYLCMRICIFVFTSQKCPVSM